MELNDLLTRALAHQTPKKTRRKPTDTITAKELADAERRIKERFTLPENWTAGRLVMLVHDESDTLLGNFQEYTHNLTVGCRRLVRVDKPSAIGEIERVSGDHWLHTEPLVRSDKAEFEAEEVREAIVDLHMPELDNVFAPGVEVAVTLNWGSISRIELVKETWFYGKDKRVQLSLPEGLDVREGLSLETRVRLKEFLGL